MTHRRVFAAKHPGDVSPHRRAVSTKEWRQGKKEKLTPSPPAGERVPEGRVRGALHRLLPEVCSVEPAPSRPSPLPRWGRGESVAFSKGKVLHHIALRKASILLLTVLAACSHDTRKPEKTVTPVRVVAVENFAP